MAGNGTAEERLARLELHVNMLARNDHEMLDEIKKVSIEVTKLTQEFGNKKGFVLGVIFSVSAIWAAGIGIFQIFKPG